MVIFTPAMSVRIQLDRHQGAYTNLDYISGVVVLNILGPETIQAIKVKLEGESRSRLAGPANPRPGRLYEKERAQLEVHKVSKCILTANGKTALLNAIQAPI